MSESNPERMVESWRQKAEQMGRECRAKTWSYIEQQAAQLSRDIQLDLLRIALSNQPEVEAQTFACSQCTRNLRIQQWAQSRTMRTRGGDLEYQRAYGVCDGCGHTGAPLDEALGIPPKGASIGVVERVCHAAVVGRSFEIASEMLAVHGQMECSAKHARSVAEKEGRGLVELQESQVWEYRHRRRPLESSARPALLVIGLDGGRVQMRRREERWKEDKIAVVYDAQPVPPESDATEEYRGASPLVRTYVATMEEWEKMGWKARVEAEKRGYCHAREKMVLADGAVSIRELHQTQFPEATFVLDWVHAVEHLGDCSRAAFGEGTSQAEQWRHKHKQLLWEGNREPILAEIQRLSKIAGPPQKTDTDESPRVILHRNATSYFPRNRDAMNYPLFRSKGWPIGSGVVEATVKQFGLRMKGSEKFWNLARTGAEEMLALCALYYAEDGRWQSHWEQRAAPRRSRLTHGPKNHPASSIPPAQPVLVG